MSKNLEGCNQHSRDMNGNLLPMPFRILRFIGFGIVGVIPTLALFSGSDSGYALAQVFAGVLGGVASLVVMRCVKPKKQKSLAKRFFYYAFTGIFCGIVLVSIFIAGFDYDVIVAGAGMGVGAGLLLSLSWLVLRAAFLSFSSR